MWQCEHKMCLRLGGFWGVLKTRNMQFKWHASYLCVVDAVFHTTGIFIVGES